MARGNSTPFSFGSDIKEPPPLTVALYILPNAIVGVLGAWIVSKTLHVVPGHWILTASMVCFALGPVFFLPQIPDSSYWALSMPGVALATFGPDLSFCRSGHFHHLERAQILPGLRWELAGHRAKSNNGYHDGHKRLNRGKGRRTAHWRNRTGRHQGHLVVWACLCNSWSSNYRYYGSHTESRGKRAYALMSYHLRARMSRYLCMGGYSNDSLF